MEILISDNTIFIYLKSLFFLELTTDFLLTPNRIKRSNLEFNILMIHFKLLSLKIHPVLFALCTSSRQQFKMQNSIQIIIWL